MEVKSGQQMQNIEYRLEWIEMRMVSEMHVWSIFEKGKHD